MDIKLIRAFIASPGGLDAERRAAFAAAEEVNRSVAQPLGGRLELVGWEETLSGVGRPQAIINADMDSCDLFIGAIWTRWGSRPALDGRYTSGFEEEFELSRARHAQSKRPIMAMFFKDVDTLQLRDPGEELKKVLQFQEKLREEKKFLYKSFATADDFAAEVRKFLSFHVVQMLKESEAPRQERPSTPKTSAENPPQKAETSLHSDMQEAEFLVVAAASLRVNEDLSPASAARLRLVAALAGNVSNDKLVLGVHDSNLLYEHREGFNLSTREKWGLLSSGLTEFEQENVPVWSWLAALAKGRPWFLTGLTAFGEEARRVGAIIAMQRLGEPIQPLPAFQGEFVDKYWLANDAAAAVKLAALRYLREHGNKAQLDAIEKEAGLANKETIALAHEAAVSILLRENELEATRYILSTSFETFDAALLHQTLIHLVELGSEELVRGLDHRSPVVRARAVQVLSERGALGLETIRRARDDDSAIVRLAAVRAMERADQPISLDEAYKVLYGPRRSTGLLGFMSDFDPKGLELFRMYRAERLHQMSPQLLEALLGVSEHRDAAYLALATRRIGNFGDELRGDLRDGFRAYFARQWPEGVKSTPGTTQSRLGMLSISDPAEEKRRELVRDALDVVSRQRDRADLALVREVLDQKFVAPTAVVIAYLKALGDVEDIARLADTPLFPHIWPADGDFRRDFDEAARIILKWHIGQFTELLERPIPEVMRGRLIDLISPSEFAKLPDQGIVKLLLTEEPIVRRAAAKKVPASLPRPRVRKVLANYKAEDGGRYYIVSHWLDLGLAYPRSVSKRVVVATV